MSVYHYNFLNLKNFNTTYNDLGNQGSNFFQNRSLVLDVLKYIKINLNLGLTSNRKGLGENMIIDSIEILK